jgi:cathepsin L
MTNPDSCGGTGGCEGAIAELAFNYTAEKGIPLANDFPYTASDSACIDYTPAVKVDGYVLLPANDADALATAIANIG